MPSYQLTKLAVNDLEDIFDHTNQLFNSKQASRYLQGLETIFFKLSQNPKMGRARHEIRLHLRSIRYQNHVIFYRIQHKSVIILRVLHGSRDLPNLLR
jgi:toxin ParE1/3/4